MRSTVLWQKWKGSRAVAGNTRGLMEFTFKGFSDIFIESKNEVNEGRIRFVKMLWFHCKLYSIYCLLYSTKVKSDAKVCFVRKSIETHLSSFKICSAFKYINSSFWSLEFIQKFSKIYISTVLCNSSWNSKMRKQLIHTLRRYFQFVKNCWNARIGGKEICKTHFFKYHSKRKRERENRWKQHVLQSSRLKRGSRIEP